MMMRRRGLVVVLLYALAAARPCPACTGDCNSDNEVTIDEVVKGVNIALETLPVAAGAAFDQNGDGQVTVDEVIAAVNAALLGCPAAATPTPSTTLPPATPTASPTSTVHAPLMVTPLPIYRTFPGNPITLPLPVADADGTLQCSSAGLPQGAQFDATSRKFEWTPREDQLGPFYVPFTCHDAASASASGTLTFKIEPLDTCGTPVCDPAVGCSKPLPPVDTNCCSEGAAARVAEPSADCPGGLVVFVGDNQEAGFGRLQNCDLKRVRNQAQSAAEVRFHVEARCISLDDRPRLRIRLETARRLLFDHEYRIAMTTRSDGYAERLGVAFPVDRLTSFPDFTDIEGSEANMTLTLRDARNQEVTQTLRLRLTFTPVPDLPDVDPTPTPAAP